MDKILNNYYEILEIEPSTDQSLIIKAAQAKVAKINQAFRILNNPQQRKLYDAQLMNEFSSENFYALLGVESNIEATLIQPIAQAKAIEVDKAFRTLNDPEKRRNYDELLAQLNTVSETVITHSTQRQRPAKRYVNTVGHVSPRESIFKRLFAQIADNLSTFETPSSIQDVVVFILSLLFFLYMVSSFFK